MNKKLYNVGLVLSGGGARGFAHLGILKAINEAGIFPDVVAGTSAGAIVGALYCDGYTPDEIMKILRSRSWLDYMRPYVSKTGLLSISGLQKILKDNLRSSTFDELKIKFYATATDYNNGKAIYFDKGDLVKIVIASASIPVIFKPVIIDGITYCDGGVLDNLPIQPLEGKCRVIIGSYVNPVGPEKKFSSLIQIAERTFLLNLSREVLAKASKFDLLIAPSELKNFPVLDPDKSEEVFSIGYQTAKDILKSKEIMNRLLFKDL